MVTATALKLFFFGFTFKRVLETQKTSDREFRDDMFYILNFQSQLSGCVNCEYLSPDKAQIQVTS
jgi:hypothetical protein